MKSSSKRCVEAEELDGLAADDPRAIRSRRDLKRVHRAMRTLPILRRRLAGLSLANEPRRILEIGAGDGTLLLYLARSLPTLRREVDLTLLDRQAVVSGDTLNAYAELGWRATVQCIDVLDWAARAPAARYDLCFANLFLHHFERAPLAGLLRGIAAAADAFIACEPRRTGLARLGSRLIGLLGVNAVTRDDAVKSVAAGFDGRELTCAWEAAGIAGWRTDEHFAPPFTHCFSAVRDNDRPSST